MFDDEMPYSSYLITGGLGFLGTETITKLFQSSTCKIIVLDNLLGQSDLARIPSSIRDSERFSFVIGDVVNEQLVLKTLRDYEVDCLIDFASHAGCAIAQSPVKGARNAIQGVTHVLEACRNYKHLKSYLLVSGQSVYGSNFSQSESEPLSPTCIEGAALMGAEAMLHSYVVSYRLPLAIVRLSNGIVVPNMMEKVGKLERAVNLITASDVVLGILLAADRPGNAEVWNVGGKMDYSPVEIKKLLSGETSTLSSTNSIFKTDKITKELGFGTTGNVIAALRDSTKVVMTKSSTKSTAKILVYGGKGWIGQQFVELLHKEGVAFEVATTRPGFDKDDLIKEEIVCVAPSHIVCMIGRTQGEGINSIAYLEGGPDKLKLNMRDNLYAPWILASICEKMNIHFTYLGTGCLFKYDQEHTFDGLGYTEEDVGNYDGTSYSVVKSFTDRLLRHFKNTLQCRIRLPVNYEADSRNLVAKVR
uniref:Epimerase domain-containing protein n=1 Tax=Heterorhabditis bacteriophora TaxID=37862 RepID=A0A1I7WS04_HETBA